MHKDIKDIDFQDKKGHRMEDGWRKRWNGGKSNIIISYSFKRKSKVTTAKKKKKDATINNNKKYK